MEAALNQLATTIITLLAFMFVSFVAITLIVHKGLNSVIPSKELRDGIIKLFSIAAFAVIGMVVLSGK